MIGNQIVNAPPRSETQQIRAASSPGPGVGVQGVPAIVTNVGVTRKTDSGGNVQLYVSFTANPNDRYFASAKIYLKQGTNAPVLVTEGNHSPLPVTVPKSSLPSTIFVQSVGSWGSFPVSIESCPGKSVSLI